MTEGYIKGEFKSDPPIPLSRIIIDGVEIPSERIAQGGVDHDIDQAQVTVTFINVRNVETVYQYMEHNVFAEDGRG